MTEKDFEEMGYTDVRWIGEVMCGLMPMMFTTGLFVGLHDLGYDRRYCYENVEDATFAIITWNGKGHPPGPWIKCKGSCGDILNPELTA